jgi:hypothetical protein
VDVLENELSRGRISHAGPRLKRAYERLPAAANCSNWQGGDRIDPVQARNLKEDRALDALRAIQVLEERAAGVIGSSGVAFLSQILRDGWTFTELAARTSARGSRADVSRMRDRFRCLLAELADAWAAGPEGRRSDTPRNYSGPAMFSLKFEHEERTSLDSPALTFPWQIAGSRGIASPLDFCSPFNPSVKRASPGTAHSFFGF